MKLTLSLFGLAAAGLLAAAGAGCNKTPAPSVQPVKQNGVAIESRKLQQALMASPSEAVKKDMQKVSFNLRYHNYVEVMMALDRIKGDSSLTEDQKKLVDEVMEQVKQASNARDGAAGAAEPAAK